MVSMFQTAIPISGILGGILSGWILDHVNGPLGFRGWQWLFLIEALPAIFLGLAVWFYLDDGIEQAHWLTPAKKEFLARNIEEKTRPRRVCLYAPFSRMGAFGACAS